METSILIEGELGVGEDVVLRFYPELASLLEGIRARGWSYRFTHAKGRARVRIDLERLSFSLVYHPPDLEEPDDEGFYEIKAEVGRRAPGIVEVERIDELRLSVAPDGSWWSVEVDPLNNVVTYVPDVLWRVRRGEGGRLHEARCVYEVAKFFLDKGYRPKDKYVVERYKDLVDVFEKPYSFTVALELTVYQEELVPNWEDLVDQLARFFQERGLLVHVKYKDDGKSVFGLRKPLP